MTRRPDGVLEGDSSRRVWLRRIEDEVLRRTRNEVEFFILLDVSGTPLYAKLGQRHAVGDRVLHAVALPRAELQRHIGTGYLFTHNHPTGSSFTPEDVIVMAFLNVREG